MRVLFDYKCGTWTEARKDIFKVNELYYNTGLPHSPFGKTHHPWNMRGVIHFASSILYVHKIASVQQNGVFHVDRRRLIRASIVQSAVPSACHTAGRSRSSQESN